MMLKQALKWGVTYWDTADCYGSGKSEEGIGKFFSRYPEQRKNVFLVSKSDDRDPEGMSRLLNRSLKRMNTNYIDLYFVHAISDIDEINEDTKKWESEDRQWILKSTMEILKHLHPDLGKIKFQAFQNFRIEMVELEVDFNKKLNEYPNKKLIKKLYQHDWNDFWLIYTTILDFYYYLSYPNLLKSFNSCIIKN